jgi:hypothetical protein
VTYETRFFKRTWRREFLRDTSLGLAGVATSGGILGIGVLHAGPGKRQNLGLLVGLGNLSTNQIALPPKRLSARRDRHRHTGQSEDLVREIQYSEKNIYNYQTYDKIAENPDIDVIYVVLPNSMHPEYTMRAAGRQACPV